MNYPKQPLDLSGRLALKSDEPAEAPRFDRFDVSAEKRAEEDANNCGSKRSSNRELRAGTARFQPNDINERIVLTVDETCKALRFSRAKAYQMMANGSLPYVLIGGRRKIRTTTVRLLAGETEAE